MTVYRIAKTKERAGDLSGTGAFKVGGRWNNPGVFSLYTSESQALAMLELLVHLEESELPPDLYIITVEIGDNAPILELKDEELPKDWRLPDNLVLKGMGDRLLLNKQYLGFRVRSAVMPDEYNLVLNPLFLDFNKLVKITGVDRLEVDQRLNPPIS
jgi:RES domain-containing protein